MTSAAQSSLIGSEWLLTAVASKTLQLSARMKYSQHGVLCWFNQCETLINIKLVSLVENRFNILNGVTMRTAVQLHGELCVRSLGRDDESEPARYDDVIQNNYHGYIVVHIQIKRLKLKHGYFQSS